MLLLIASHLRYLIIHLVVFMTVVRTYFYIVVYAQQGCRNLKFQNKSLTQNTCFLPNPYIFTIHYLLIYFKVM
jgi:hypothetical protein